VRNPLRLSLMRSLTFSLFVFASLSSVRESELRELLRDVFQQTSIELGLQ
jgi:hypothetical protein